MKRTKKLQIKFMLCLSLAAPALLTNSSVAAQINSGTIEYKSEAGETAAPNLPLAKAFSESLKNGPRAAAIRGRLGIARAGLATATQSSNPSYFSDRGLMAEQVSRIGPTFAMDMPWKVFLRLMAAKRFAEQSKIDLLTAIWALRAETRRAYLELVLAQETERTLRQVYELSDRLSGVSKKLFEAGAVPELDVLKGKLAAARAAADLAVGQKRVQRAKQQLNIIMGRPLDTPLNLSS
ncbi:MAG: TolC family protein, partial [Candidatus Obscuribacterales bacterium]|nr:TolC family protein [Candidatus Obscuribacterales bacterium]